MNKLTYLLILTIFPHLLFAQVIFQEDFETNNTNENPPTGWICDADGWLAGEGIQNHGREPHNGDWYAYLNWDSDQWMYKEIDLVAGESYEYSMWYKTDGFTGFSMEIMWGDSPNPANMIHEMFPSTEISNDAYVEYRVNFTSTQTGSFYLGIHGTADNTPWYLCLDDIELRTINDLEYTVQRLNADTLIQSGGSHDYLIEIENIGMSDDVLLLESFPSTDWNSEFYNINGSGPIFEIDIQSFEKDTVILRQFVPETDVEFGQIEETYFNLISTSGGNTHSNLVISTALTPISDFPLVEGFEEELFPPMGWYANIENGDKNYERTSLGEWPTCIPHDNTLAMVYYNSFSAQAGETALLISPELVVPDAEYIMRFWFYRTDNISNKADKVEIYLSEDIELNNADLLGSIHRTISMDPVETTEGWFEYSYVFSGSAINKHIVFKAVSDYGWNMYIDDIKIDIVALDEDAPEFMSINELEQYADLAMPIEMVIRDDSDVTETMQGIYNVGNGEEYFEMYLSGKSKGNFTYTGNIPAQINETYGTVKFIMEDVFGNSAETDLFDIHWTGIAPLLEESFENDFLPNGWAQIMGQNTWFIWQKVNEEEYTDSDEVVYTVTPPDGEYQAMVGWDWQGNYQDEWLISPDVEITDLADLTFETFAQIGSYDYDHFVVAISTNGGTSWTEEWDAFYMDNEVIEYDETIIIPLDDYLGETIKVAWRAYNQAYDNLWYSWFIDDVKIEKRTNVSINEINVDYGFDFSILSNPIDDDLKISLLIAQNDPLKITIRDILGNIVLQEEVKTNAAESILFSTQMNHLVSGVYICSVSQNGEQISKLIIKK